MNPPKPRQRDAGVAPPSEEQTRQAKKLETLGRLTAGIVHDFNNSLTVVTGYSELLLKGLSEHDPCRPDIEQVKKAGERAGSLSRRLLALTRRQAPQPRVLDMNAVIEDLLPMLQRLIRENIELVTVLGSGLNKVKLDDGQIEHILINLVMNACDAMPSGGRITVETSNVIVGEAQVNTHRGARSGPHVVLTVSDTGCGMDREILPRVFEPFFTTKEPGKGTGLGLSIVQEIAHEAGGDINVHSEVGRGTTFSVVFPHAGPPLKCAPASPSSTSWRCGTETILLVEDERAVRAFVRDLLQGHGYTVLEARDANEAVRIHRQHAQPIHLLITDVVMPQMLGPELAKALIELSPSMKVVLMTGYADCVVANRESSDPRTRFMQKPFGARDLLESIRSLLDSSSGVENGRVRTCASTKAA